MDLQGTLGISKTFLWVLRRFVCILPLMRHRQLPINCVRCKKRRSNTAWSYKPCCTPLRLPLSGTLLVDHRVRHFRLSD